MPVLWLVLIVLVMAVAGYMLGRARALKSAGGDSRDLHSLPSYYGANVTIMTLVPAVGILIVWLLVQPILIDRTISSTVPAEAISDSMTRGLFMSDVRRIADGLDLAVTEGAMGRDEADNIRAEFTDIRDRLGNLGVALGSDVGPEVLRAAQRYRTMSSAGNLLMTLAVLAAAGVGFTISYMATGKNFRARNVVEKVIRYLLIFAATIAILTTIGILLSLVFNTIEFFRLYPAEDFFLGLTWSPSFGGGSELGILPLLWGTLYISIIALLVAVPIGLFAAIFLSEYASSTVRSFAKPMIEVLAGIPTIVYGLFALLTVGPLLMRVFGDDGIGIMQAGTAVMTAGLVMGIMLIPFVSSLSDDIINAVPQSMRDGSLGLGATRSETVKQVVLPAALPGIVGAILLAASRAIGETMIVVLGAGAAARLSMNPFDAMTTVTAKIVSQLTGDADFASPEALVAFALGMTLFVITLGLNVFALYIVRKYREQYE
ncbi:phosphate transport system permease protein [Rhodovulum iodosum]|uniref:Phosphate transport system permease protein n=1 Tax=Rhodovulum iodosum TaxID=68291 RepID=A0ABV3XV42_9RHOB|nr:phosphate ABC transporter permease subunit PstC [Rhodovulum robiginosum]RSK35002.1 phosphate ABC transporter permease subunit PstC [Rhodovulum robiginosum]